MRSNEKGFGWKEVVVILGVIIILVVVAWPNYGAYNKPREAELKANIHTIQIACERFATDHNEYPAYLLGGDIDGWENWHSTWDGVNDITFPDGRISSNNIVIDPLVKLDYITSYPHNPFVGDGEVIIARTNNSGGTTQGDGDPRFGFKGNIMGNGLDDPYFFCGALQADPSKFPEIETRRTLDHGIYMDVPDAFQNPTTNPYYLFGGFRNPENPRRPLRTWWPGNFFYRARPNQDTVKSSGGFTYPHVGVTGKPAMYILGGYGPLDIKNIINMDVIRLTPFDPDGNRVSWRLHPEGSLSDFKCGYGFNTHPGGFGSLPEVFGGGDDYTGPAYPYIDDGGPGSGMKIYDDWGHSTAVILNILPGAPDGVPDGVIIVLTGIIHQ